MNKVKIKKYILLISVTFVFILICIFYSNKNYSKIEKISHEIGGYIEKKLIPTNFEFDNVNDGINKELELELNELKQMLNLKESSYKFIQASVIKRDTNWYQEITIDKGEKDGIKSDMAVVSNDSLIGRVTKTTYSNSTVKLLTTNNNDMKVSVTIKTPNTEAHGIIDAYLEKENALKVNNVLKTSDIDIGAIVYTDGLGGIYPAGIYVGEVVEVTEDSLGLNKILKVKTSSYDNIRFVSVIDRS